MFSSWTCSCFGARTHFCVIFSPHSQMDLHSHSPQPSVSTISPSGHFSSCPPLSSQFDLSVSLSVLCCLCHLCCLSFSLSLLHFFPLRKSFFPPKISWAEPPVCVLLSAFLSFRLPPEWTFDLGFQHCRAFLAPSSKFFPGPPVTQFQEAKHHMVRITIAMTPVSVASFFVSSLSRGCDQIPDKVSLRKEWVSLRIHFIMAREPQYQDHR